MILRMFLKLTENPAMILRMFLKLTENPAMILRMFLKLTVLCQQLFLTQSHMCHTSYILTLSRRIKYIFMTTIVHQLLFLVTFLKINHSIKVTPTPPQRLLK